MVWREKRVVEADAVFSNLSNLCSKPSGIRGQSQQQFHHYPLHVYGGQEPMANWRTSRLSISLQEQCRRRPLPLPWAPSNPNSTTCHATRSTRTPRRLPRLTQFLLLQVINSHFFLPLAPSVINQIFYPLLSPFHNSNAIIHLAFVGGAQGGSSDHSRDNYLLRRPSSSA